MPRYKNQQELIDGLRKKAPNWSYYKSDEDIYNIWADENRKAGEQVAEYVKPTISSIDINKTNFTTAPNKDSSPQEINELKKAGDSMLASGLAELGTGEGFMGISADFFKKSYNESNAGLYYQWKHGKPKYKYSSEDYKVDGWAAEAGSFLLGMINPIEAGVFAASMGSSVLASGATKLGIGFLSNLGRKAFVSSAAKGGTGLTTTLATSAMSSGTGLGTFGAAHGAFASAASQKTTTGQVDLNKVAEDASDAFVESFMIGAPAGLIGRGGLGRMYATKKMAEKPLTSLPRLATGLPGQYATEVAAFSALPNLYKAVGLESYKDYPMLFSDEWNKQTAMNAAIIGPMFFTPPALKKIFGEKVKTAEDSKLEFEDAKLDKISESLDNVEINSMGFDLGKDFANKVSEHASIKNASKSEVARFNENRKRLEEIYNNAQGDANKVSVGDREFVVGRDAQEALSFKKGILQDLVNNPNELKEIANIIKAKEGKTGEANPIEVEALKAEFKDVISEIDKSRKQFTDLSLGIEEITKPAEPRVEEVPVTPKEAPPVEPTPKVVEGIPGIKKSVEEFRKTADEATAQVSKRIKKLADMQELMEAEKPFTDAKKAADYNYNQEIVTRIMQETLPMQKATAGAGAGAYVKDYSSRSKQMQAFSKHVVEQGYSFKNVTDDIVKKYVAKNPGHKTAVAQLVGKLTTVYRSENLTIGAGEITAAAKPEVAEVRAGVLSDKKSTVIGSESITMTLSKQAATGAQERYITKETAKILKKLQEDSDKTLSKYLFNDKEGYSLGNAELNALVVKIFGAKPKAVANSPARAFRKSMLTWAQKKFKGTKTPETELIKREILKDKSDIDKITEAYGKAEFKNEAKKLVTKFLADIKKAKGTAKGEKVYSVQEIKKGLAVDFSKDIIIKVKGKERVISGDVAEGIARYLVEAGPRLNEVVSGIRRPSGEFQRQPIGAPAGVKEMQRILREEIAKNPKVKVKTVTDADYAGAFADGVIYVNLNKANKKTWYHENSHRLKDMIDKVGDKELQKVWKQGEKIFANDAKKEKQTLSEFIPDEIMRWADGQSKTPTLASKMKNWTEKLWSKITKLFFGKDYLTKSDVRRLLGEKVLKGFADIPEYRKAVRNSEGMPQYQFENVKERAKSVKKDFDFAVKQAGGMSRSTRKGVIEHIAREAGIEKPKEFSLTDKNVSEADVIKFQQQLNEVPFEDIARVAKIEDAYKNVQTIRAIEKGFIDKKTRNKMLSFFGIKADNLYQLVNDVSATNKYKNFLLQSKYPGVKQSGAHLLERIVQSDNTLPNSVVADFNRPGFLKKWMMRGIYSGHGYVGALGGKFFKSLENKLLKHANHEQHHIGRFVEGFEARAAELIGKNWESSFGNDMQIVLAKQRLLERLDLGVLTDSHKSFIKKVYKTDAIQIKDGKHIINPKYKKYKERFKDRPKDASKNPTLEATHEYIEFTEYVKKEFKEITKKFFETKEEHAAYLADNPLNFLKNELYTRYELTPQMRKVMDKLGTFKDKFINDESLKIAKKMAVKKYGTKASAKNISEFEVAAFEKASELFANMQKYRESYKISDSFFKKRNPKLPEFLEIDGKNIEVYKSEYSATKQYGLGVSKALATIEFFPDRYKVKLKGGAENYSSEKMLLELIDKSPEHGRVVKEIVDRQLGEYGSYTEATREFGSFMNQAASIFAKTALGFPTSGFKNFTLGQAQTLGFLRFRNYIGSMVDVMSSDFRKYLRLTGQQEVGLRHIDDITFMPKVWDKLFALGGMKPTENANRYLSSAGGRRYAREEIDVLHYKNFSSKRKAKAEGRLKDKFFFDDAQIAIAKKYGNNGMTGHEFPSSFERSKVKRQLDNVEKQILTYSHINTQGATTGLFQPIWANGPLAKPLTLFKRMAYAASDNTLRNIKTAYKYGEYGRLVTIGLAPYAAGYTLMAMNNFVLGKPMPKENSNHAAWVKHLLIEGEALGAATDILNFMEGENAETTVYPALYNWVLAFTDAIRAPIQGKKTIKQSAEDLLKASSSAYRNSIKVYEKMNNPYKIGYNKYRTLKYDFLEEEYPDKPHSSAYSGNDISHLGTRSDVYRDFKATFLSGNVDAIAKQYVNSMYVLAADMYRQKLKKDDKYNLDDYQVYLKKAISQLDGDITSMHPNPYDVDKKYSGSNKKLNEKVRVSWYEWLSKDEERVKVYAKELQKLTKQYNSKIMGLNKHIENYMGDPELIKQIQKSVRRHLKSNTIILY